MSMKQVILVRKDLQMKKSELAALVARASTEFMLENNESRRNDEMFIKLTPQESEWIQSGSTRIVLGVPSGESLQGCLFKAEMAGIGCYPIMKMATSRIENHFNDSSIVCVSLGPDESEKIDAITNKFKLL